LFDNIEEKQIENILELLEELLEFYEGDNWLIVKKYILRYSRPECRKNFSTRHHKSKKHALNDFEKKLINYCQTNYNIKLKLYENDKHK